MVDGYIPKSIVPVSGNIDMKPDAVVPYQDILAAAPIENVSSSSNVASIGGTQLKKISPYEPTSQMPVAPQSYSVTGSGVSEQPFSQKLLERFSSFFSLPGGKGRDVSVDVPGSLPRDGGAPKTAEALRDFEKVQQVSVGYALLSSLTQSVLSSVKRLTQGQ